MGNKKGDTLYRLTESDRERVTDRLTGIRWDRLTGTVDSGLGAHTVDLGLS